jgi:hypothetical protein
LMASPRPHSLARHHRSGRADRASGRCPAGESMLGGLNSPADFVSKTNRRERRPALGQSDRGTVRGSQ